jgi:RecA-family ATPase
MFSGSENDRPQVTQFVGLLKKLCRKHDCAVLLLAQPSVLGMNIGSGTSGSTGWGNAGRSRLYFQRAIKDGVEPNRNLRTLEGKKSNYSEIGGKFEVEWKDGLFRRVIGPTGFDKAAAEQGADGIFLTLLVSITRSGCRVSANPGVNYAPAVFAKDPGNPGLTKDEITAAMRRLLANGTIKNVPFGPPSHQRFRLEIVDQET